MSIQQQQDGLAVLNKKLQESQDRREAAIKQKDKWLKERFALLQAAEKKDEGEDAWEKQREQRKRDKRQAAKDKSTRKKHLIGLLEKLTATETTPTSQQPPVVDLSKQEEEEKKRKAEKEAARAAKAPKGAAASSAAGAAAAAANGE